MTFSENYITIALRLNRNESTNESGGDYVRVTIKAARVNVGLSQTAFAKAIGVGVRTVQSWESGASSPRADKMPEICAVLKCRIEDIIFLPSNCG